MVRRMLVVLGLAALGVAGVLALRPVHAEVSTSLLPDVVRDAVDVRLGGRSGLTLHVDGPTATVDCGPSVAPYTITIEDRNVLSRLAGVADRVEARIADACGAAVDRRRLQAGGAGAGALLLFALAIAARPSPATVVVAAPPGWTGTGAGAGAPWPAGPPPVTARPMTAATPPRPNPAPPPGASVPPPPPAGAAGFASSSTGAPWPAPGAGGAPADGGPGGRPTGGRRALVPAAVVGGLVALGLAGWWAVARSGADDVGSSRPTVQETTSTTEDPRLALARTCMTESLAAADRGFDAARTRSQADQANSKLNLDGDGSFRDYAAQLEATDVSDCPTDFRAAFLQYTAAWRDYGDKLRAATKGPLRGSFSDADRVSIIGRINQARQLLEDIAAARRAPFVHQSYSAT